MLIYGYIAIQGLKRVTVQSNIIYTGIYVGFDWRLESNLKLALSPVTAWLAAEDKVGINRITM